MKSILKSSKMHSHVIPTDGDFPSQLIVGSISEWVYDVAGCLLARTLPWQREHGPDLSKKAWVAVSVIHPGLRFQTTRNLKPNIYLGFICFHDFICFLRFFCPLTHCLFCFTSLTFALKVFAYTDFSVVPLGPWCVVISISNRV